ncbi:hypothetical protein [Methanosphaera sp.]|jgi:hypothetical protein|uniref:hypothetical protein n=1 Tax=Methanosphaera sp. TaxID=2666342 RepID=UPI003D8CDFF5
MTQVVSITPEEKWAVEADAGSETVHIRADKANAGLNADPKTLTGGSKSIQKVRVGYPEPSSELESSIDTKLFHRYMYAALGNYKFTAGTTESPKNVHEFYGGDQTKLPSCTNTLTFDVGNDVLLKTLLGACCDEFTLETSDDLSTASTTWVYKTEHEKKLSQAQQQVYDEVQSSATPFIGYDYTVTLGSDEAVAESYVFNDLKLEIKNNHQTDGSRGLGNRFYGRQPNVGDREISLEMNTIFDTSNLQLVVQSEYGDLITDDNGNWIPSPCKIYTVPLSFKIQTCEDAEEYVFIKFPKCIISIDPLEFSGTDDVEVKLTLQPMGTSNITLKDGTTSVKTDIYVQVVNDQPELKKY